MTDRERIINTLTGRKTDRLPFFVPMGPWGETIEEWKKQGLQGGWHEGFGFDRGIREIGVNLGYCPAFEYKILEENEHTRIVRDNFGITMELMRDHATIPKYLDYPVKTDADWLELKKRLDPSDPARFPENWGALIKEYNEGDYAIQIGSYPYGLFGMTRDMMGVEELLYAFYDNPGLVRDMMGCITDMWLEIWGKICKDVKVDIIHMWEDMSGKDGSLISMDMVREFMSPNYKRMREFADKHGIEIFSLDTDGNCSQLVPVFIESGINYIWPFEVAAGSDIVEFRRLYPELAIMGGIDKREIANGREAIDKEFERIAPMKKHGRYLPGVDHLIHPQISWEDFKYYIAKLKEYTHMI
jgi:uroporphyrinogen decarboxylase